MKMAEPIAHLFACPVDDILALLPDEGDPVWDKFGFRQQQFSAHHLTRTIAFAWPMPVAADGKPTIGTASYAGKQLTDAVMACGDRLAAHYGGALVTALLLTELQAGARIPVHVDSGQLQDITHRCHVAVLTNADVTFTIDGHNYHLPPGEAYEVDNMRQHAIANLGRERRVHLICNLLPV